MKNLKSFIIFKGQIELCHWLPVSEHHADTDTLIVTAHELMHGVPLLLR